MMIIGLVIWDTRTNQMQHQVKIHEKEVRTISEYI